MGSLMIQNKVPVLVYSRVSGYFNPVTAFNKGKREEFSERKMAIIKSIEDIGGNHAVRNID